MHGMHRSYLISFLDIHKVSIETFAENISFDNISLVHLYLASV